MGQRPSGRIDGRRRIRRQPGQPFEPKYRQIAAEVDRRGKAGEGFDRLAADLWVSRGTVLRAYGFANRDEAAAAAGETFDFLDRLSDLVPPPRKRRHRYHGVFAPNHKLRAAGTALASGSIGKRHDAAAGEHATGDSCDSCDRPRFHDSSRIA